MTPYSSAIFLIILVLLGYMLGRHRAAQSAGGDRRILHSLPQYYGMFVALWTGIPAALLIILWVILQP